MISRVHRRGCRVGGLLRYLYGPGKQEEHVNPRLVAAWDGAGELADLEPEITASGKRDFRRLTALLEEPVRAGNRPPAKPVWHCSMRLAPEDRDRVLTDGTWGRMAREMLTEAGLATEADDPGLRWVVVRHNDDHVHIVATLVREDGRTNWACNDYRKCVKATYNVARRYGLRRQVPPADRTAHRRPHPVEVNKARRKGWSDTPRDELRRRVRTAVAAAGSELEFLDRLRQAGVLIRVRRSTVNADEITGYAVALPGAGTGDGQSVWFSGGRLAPDLTLPKLRRRWGDPPPAAGLPSRGRVTARAQALRDAASVTQVAAEEIRRSAREDPAAAQAAATAAADVLTSLAYAREGSLRGPLHRAAEVLDRAARDMYARTARTTSLSYELRAMSRLVALMGRIAGDEDSVAAMALVLDMARLADALEYLRTAQQRLHQAEAARDAAQQLRTLAAGGQRPVTTPLTVAVTPSPTVDSARRAMRAGNGRSPA
ncbi:relaxase [Micromonospora sp. C31]|uniref:relaxase/mobilization nuclease domain-containing protein n=1 Tax=Micromonospora sp. C31 TaxID=2824876 RepID=UPI001B3878A8|nr:relaxase [Micromonospora sp. C31]